MKRLMQIAPMSLMAAMPLLAQTDPKDRPRLDADETYKNNCMRCHTSTPQYPAHTTQTIVMHMRVRANLTQEETEAILQYLTDGGAAPPRNDRDQTRDGATDLQQVVTPVVDASDPRQVDTAIVGASGSQTAAAPPSPPSRETIMMRTASGSLVEVVSLDPAGGTITLRTKSGERSYVLDRNAASVLAQVGSLGKLYLSWRFDKAGQAVAILHPYAP